MDVHGDRPRVVPAPLSQRGYAMRTGIRTLLAVTGTLALGLLAGQADAQQKLKVGFIYVGPVEDFGWTYQHEVGRKLVEEKRAKTITDEQFYQYQNNLVKFLDTSFGDKGTSYISMAIRTIRVLFSNRIFFHKDHVPAWTDFAKKHSNLINAANS